MYLLIKLYFRLFLKNNKGLIVISTLLITSFSIFYINLYKTKINRDEKARIYDYYIEKYKGLPSNDKEKQILAELNMYDKKTDYLIQYQNHQITKKEYLKKQNENNKNELRQDALKSFYIFYLNVKNSKNKQIENTRYIDCWNFNNLDFISLIFVFYLIYSIYLKEIDDHIWIYEQTTFNGLKNAKKSKIFVLSFIWGVYLFLNFIGKYLIFKQFSRLDFTINNISWCSNNCPHISFITYIFFCTFLYFISSYILCMISILLKKFIYSNIFILIVVFMFVYIPLSFLGNSISILCLPFVSFLVPGRYFTGYGEKMIGADFHIIIIELMIILIFLFFHFFKIKRKYFIIFLTSLLLLTGCQNKQVNFSCFQYNSYHEINFLENNSYYYFSNKIISKKNWQEYSLVRNLYESNSHLTNVFSQQNGFFYTIEDEEDEYLYCFNEDFQDFKLKKLSSNQKNFMNIEQQHSSIIEKNILGIIGNQKNYYIIYSNKIENQNNRIVYKGNLTQNYSIYNHDIYFLQDNHTLIRISLDSFKKEKLDTPLCDYFYIKNNCLYLHNIQDNKLYCNKQLLFYQEIENSDIYDHTLYYSNKDGLFKYNLNNKENSLLLNGKIYSLKISTNGNYLCYITDSYKANKEIKMVIIDLKTNKKLYEKDA